MKKLLLPILAVFMVLTLAGCAGAQLTVEEYKTAMTEWLSEYSEASGAYAAPLSTGDYATAKAKVGDCMTVLDKLAALNAPDKYKTQQQEIANSVKLEKEYLKTVQDFLDVAINSPTDVSAVSAANDKMSDAQAKATLITKYMEVAKQLGTE